jgi:hypothetical protein
MAGRVVLAEAGIGDSHVVDTRDATSEFLLALVSYIGEDGELQFGTPDDQFVVTIRRVDAKSMPGDPVIANDR